MKHLIFADVAEQELEAIGDRIALDSPVRALTFVRELRASCFALVEMPHRNALLSRHRSSGIRRRVHGKYLIFYRVVGDTVEILHILHGAMDYEAVLFPDG